jgi:hypothetical protein
MSRITKLNVLWDFLSVANFCQFLPIFANSCLIVPKVSFSKGKNWQELARIGKNWQNQAKSGKIRQKLAELLGPNKKARIGKNWQELATVKNTHKNWSFQNDLSRNSSFLVFKYTNKI